MSDIKLTKNEAFLAMYSFLEEYYQLTHSDDIGGLLGSMSLLSDGTIADEALADDWKKAVKKALNKSVDASLVLKNT